MTTLEQLKPCPFCGSEAYLTEHGGRIASGHYTAWARCSHCESVEGGCQAELTQDAAAREAINDWNTRSREVELEQKLAIAIEAMTYALWQHEGRGTPFHNHWSAKMREALSQVSIPPGVEEPKP